MRTKVFLVEIISRMLDPVQCAFNPLPERDWLNLVSMHIHSNRIRYDHSQSGFNAQLIRIECLVWTDLKTSGLSLKWAGGFKLGQV